MPHGEDPTRPPPCHQHRPGVTRLERYAHTLGGSGRARHDLRDPGRSRGAPLRHAPRTALSAGPTARGNTRGCVGSGAGDLPASLARSRSVPAGRSHEEAWLVRVLINIRRDQWRKAEVRRRSAPLVGTESATVAAHQESGLMAWTIVWRALDRLPPRRRAVIVLHELEGAGLAAIASLLGISAITVRGTCRAGDANWPRLTWAGRSQSCWMARSWRSRSSEVRSANRPRSAAGTAAPRRSESRGAYWDPSPNKAAGLQTGRPWADLTARPPSGRSEDRPLHSDYEPRTPVRFAPPRHGCTCR